MRNFTLNLTDDGVTLTAYLPEQSPEMKHMAKRPTMLVLPGGAYMMCSDREAEPIAFSYNMQGYNAFVLRYTVGKGAAAFPRPLEDADLAMKTIIDNAEEWNVDTDKIAAIGFSAGGHLCAALATMGKIRPAAVVLGYPCILESISHILAEPVPSLDDKVDEKTSPAFIFHAAEDGCVPVEHSLAYSTALAKAGIPFELHVFEKGFHGFSVANSSVFDKKEYVDYHTHLKCWVEMSARWLDGRFNN